MTTGNSDPRVRELFGHLRLALNILEELMPSPSATLTPSPKDAVEPREDVRP